MVNGDGAAPPFLCRLMPLIQTRVMAYRTIDLIRLQYAIVISHVQDFVAGLDAFQLRIVWKSYAVPAVCFCQGCLTQSTDGVCSDVPASIKRLVVTQLCGSLPTCSSAQGSHPVTDAILGATGMIDNSCHDIHIFAAGCKPI
jgi:hypothetical protein